jgi:hypothetical protein
MKYLILVIEIIHTLINLSILIPFFINDKNILLYYYYFYLLLIGGLILFDGCWLTQLERKMKNDEKNKQWVLIEYLEKYLNIKPSEKHIKFFHTVSYLVFILSYLVLIYKLDLFYQGLSVISGFFIYYYLHNKNKSNRYK